MLVQIAIILYLEGISILVSRKCNSSVDKLLNLWLQEKIMGIENMPYVNRNVTKRNWRY